MAALTQSYETFEKPGMVIAYKMGAVKIFKGAMVGVNASGYVVSMAHGTANLKFVGLATETVDNSAGAAGDKSIIVSKVGTAVVKAASGFSPAQSNVGAEVYANTDWEVQVSTSGLTAQYKVGRIVALENTSTGVSGVRVRIDDYT